MASNSLAMIGTRDMTPAEAHAAYLDEKRDLIRGLCIPDAFRRDDALFETFIEIGKLRGLNPIMKQMYCIPRNGKPSIEVSIDGLRLIASRTHEYAGGDEYRWTGDGTVPESATCTVYRMVRGERCPFTCTVRWDEFGAVPYAAKYHNNWKTMPFHMLGKVAESHALRRAFPEETGGLYTTDEMAQAEPADASPPREIKQPGRPIEAPRAPSLSEPRKSLSDRERLNRKLWATAIEYYGDGITDSQERRDKAKASLHEWVKVQYDADSLTALSDAQVQEMIDAIEQGVEAEDDTAPEQAHLVSIREETAIKGLDER